MHAAIRSPLAAGVALLGAGAIAATPIAATPPDVHISDLRLTLSTQLMQINPVTAAERLVGQTATDAVTQAARVATFPIPRALLLNVSRALGVGGMTKLDTAFSTPAAAGIAGIGGGVLRTVESVVQDGVATTLRLVPASIDAVTGVVISTINAPIQIGVATIRVILNVGKAVLTLNPATILDAAALGAVRIAGVVEQTTIGTPAVFIAPQAATTAKVSALGNRIPSILTSILNGRDEIANAIFPVARRALSVAASSTALTTAAAAGQKPVAKTVATPKRTASSALKAIHTGPKHAKK
jgi:hypothetical protein